MCPNEDLFRKLGLWMPSTRTYTHMKVANFRKTSSQQDDSQLGPILTNMNFNPSKDL